MIKSMTAFARCSDHGKWGNAVWEIRAVNHRFLDCSFRLPESFRKLELDLRELIRNHLTRGRIECFLHYKEGENSALELSLNTNLVKKLINAAEQIGKASKTPLSTINPLQILSWNNVLQISETDSKIVNEKIVKLFIETLKKLDAVRKQEGNILKKLIIKRLLSVLAEINKIKKILPIILKLQREKLLAHLAEIKTELDHSRLEHEMVYFAQKINIAEELDRLAIHVQEVKRILNEGGDVGKRLDFLMQELNREANTLASKSVNKKTTHAAVELKVLIEEMREQVQNIV
jgi:uncharacterized protein (TIGR00255 family)